MRSISTPSRSTRPYYALPAERNAKLWVERTPDGFVFNINHSRRRIGDIWLRAENRIARKNLRPSRLSVPHFAHFIATPRARRAAPWRPSSRGEIAETLAAADELASTFFVANGPVGPHLITIDRLLWVLLYRLWPRCLDTMVLVKPATVVQWHRQGFRLFWQPA